MEGDGLNPTSVADGTLDTSVVGQDGTGEQVVVEPVVSQEPQYTPEQEMAILKNQLEAIQAQNDFYRSLATQTVPVQNEGNQQQVNLFEQVPGNEVPTYDTVEQLVEARLSEKMSKIDETIFELTAKSSYKAAKATYPDYDDVARLARNAIDNSPDRETYYQMIAASKDPAELIYKLGRTHPDYIKNSISTATNKIMQTVNSNIQRPSTLSQTPASGSQAISMAEKIANMSDAEFAQMEKNVMNGVYNG